MKISTEFEKYSLKYQVEYLAEKLNRPIRICGMVKNEGEPGGGPFWVKDESGSISLQIVESAQINKKSKQQKDILKGATHFNPVDLVCGIKDYKGEKFDLKKFVDSKAAFISMKTKTGKDLKASRTARTLEREHGQLEYHFCRSPVDNVQSCKKRSMTCSRHHIKLSSDV